MVVHAAGGHAAPSWFVPPGEGDMFAWLSLALIFLAPYGVVTLYAAFDRWAERKSHGTPLAKTIPTMLTIALLYEIFPLSHFHILLPVSAILIALMADWARFHGVEPVEATPAGNDAATPAKTAPATEEVEKPSEADQALADPVKAEPADANTGAEEAKNA